MAIDMHAHWSPPALIEAFRARKEPPKVATEDGVDMYVSARGRQPVSEVFDDLDKRLDEMDRQDISTAVLSLFGPFGVIERLPVEESLPLVRLFNDSTSEICQAHPGRFAAYAALPLADMNAACAEFERAMDLPGIVGAQMPGNAFLTHEDAKQFTPLMEVADRTGAVVFIHWGPRPGDAWPRVDMKAADHAVWRLGTLDMQQSLSQNMVTLSFTDFLDAYPNARVHVHNLGGNLPYELERMDHRCLLDTPDEPLPSTQLTKPNLFVDCNSFGARAIEAGVAVYGADKILFGTDGTEFGAEWSVKALAEARIDDAARRAILHDNAARLLAPLTDLAPVQAAAE